VLGCNEGSLRFRLEEQTVTPGSRELITKFDTTALWTRLFGVDVQIGEVTFSKGDEMAECT
jgi:hypothetical protein